MSSYFSQNAVDQAVHRAVCDFTGTNGARRCLHYAVAGSYLLTQLIRQPHIPQVGSLWVFAEPPDGWIEINIQHWGDPLTSLRLGEFHSWIAPASIEQAGTFYKGTLIDFSARHFKELAENTSCGGKLKWSRPKSPNLLWFDSDHSPDWVRYVVDPQATTAVMEDFLDRIELWRPLMQLAQSNYHRITSRNTQHTERSLIRKKRKAERQRRRRARR